jgi:hypothetical protein
MLITEQQNGHSFVVDGAALPVWLFFQFIYHFQQSKNRQSHNCKSYYLLIKKPTLRVFAPAAFAASIET